jgi:hypothetical protein
MTRIGRWQIKTRQLAGNASYRRDKLAPPQNFQIKLPSYPDAAGSTSFFLESHCRFDRTLESRRHATLAQVYAARDRIKHDSI